jgi:hypothetical protein
MAHEEISRFVARLPFDLKMRAMAYYIEYSVHNTLPQAKHVAVSHLQRECEQFCERDERRVIGMLARGNWFTFLNNVGHMCLQCKSV